MRFDVRLLIGLMFLILGLVVTVTGLVEGRAVAAGLNIDLVWGLVMIAFAAAMLTLAVVSGRKTRL